MILGIKITIPGKELHSLLWERAEYHMKRMDAYAEQIKSMKDNKIEGMTYSGGDPIKVLKDKHDQHSNQERELKFIAKYLDTNETYMLDDNDLRKLGIISNRY